MLVGSCKSVCLQFCPIENKLVIQICSMNFFFLNFMLMLTHGFSIPTQWIMDVLVCNGLGAYFGMKTCEYLGNKVHFLAFMLQ